MLRLLSSQGVTDGSTMSCHERRGARCHRCDESLPSPPALGKAAVAVAPGSFKKKGYLVINEVLKMRYERLNVLSHLLIFYESMYLCFDWKVAERGRVAVLKCLVEY